MLVSDVVGLFSALLLGEPGFRDQVYRYRQASAASKGKGRKLLPLYDDVAAAWKERRDSYSRFDALCTAGGGLLLMLVFIMKLAGG
jgi:hypothetical protein